MQAYAAAGISIPRTSQEQWAAGPQVSTPQPGDLVFFAGADGTVTSPGHVGIVVTGPAHDDRGLRHRTTRSEYRSTARPPRRPATTDPAGFTDPAANAGTS